MSKKDLRSQLAQIDSKPSLAVQYEKVHMDIYGIKMFAPKSKYPVFSAFSSKLRENGMDEKKYSYAIARLLEEWLKTRNLKFIPISMFCGNWCFERYAKINNSETVDIGKENEDDEILYSEVLVARYYINKNLGDTVFRMRDAVAELEPLLSKKWLSNYRNNVKMSKFMLKAVDILSDEFNVSSSKDYVDIIRKLRCN